MELLLPFFHVLKAADWLMAEMSLMEENWALRRMFGYRRRIKKKITDTCITRSFMMQNLLRQESVRG
jgi:hypothetical protein